MEYPIGIQRQSLWDLHLVCLLQEDPFQDLHLVVVFHIPHPVDHCPVTSLDKHFQRQCLEYHHQDHHTLVSLLDLLHHHQDHHTLVSLLDLLQHLQDQELHTLVFLLDLILHLQDQEHHTQDTALQDQHQALDLDQDSLMEHLHLLIHLLEETLGLDQHHLQYLQVVVAAGEGPATLPILHLRDQAQRRYSL